MSIPFDSTLTIIVNLKAHSPFLQSKKNLLPPHMSLQYAAFILYKVSIEKENPPKKQPKQRLGVQQHSHSFRYNTNY